jgi:hypothetical protein
VCCAERPIRSFESLSGVTNSWIADKSANVLMAKKTSLAPKLSRAVGFSFANMLDWQPSYVVTNR